MIFGINFMLSAVPEGRLFGLDQQTLISIGIQLINTTILAVALAAILYKPVQAFMRKRSERISGEIHQAQSKMTEALRIKSIYEKKMQEIDTERIKILEAARAAADEKSLHILEEARHEAALIRQRTDESVLNKKERLKEETRQYIIEASSLMAGKFINSKIDSDDQDRLFDETMTELEEISWRI